VPCIEPGKAAYVQLCQVTSEMSLFNMRAAFGIHRISALTTIFQ